MATLGVDSVLIFQPCDVVIDLLKFFLGSPPFKLSNGGASTLGGLRGLDVLLLLLLLLLRLNMAGGWDKRGQ